MVDGIVVSAFPGTGKSWLAAHAGGFDLTVSDSDSSRFTRLPDGGPNPWFLDDYLAHVRRMRSSHDLVLVASHREVRDRLHEERIPFVYVLPEPGLRAEYLERYRRRGDDRGFIDRMDAHWDAWTNGTDPAPMIRLGHGEHLSDVLPEIMERIH